MYNIRSNYLSVDITAPNDPPNNGFRFERAGFIEEVVLNGTHRFCASEPNNLSHPSSGGRGICSEYKCDSSEETAVGECFIKPGIGLFLKEKDEPYRFTDKYNIKTVFPIEVEQKKDALIFVTKPVACGGYALEHTKSVKVEDNRLTVQISVKNVGDRVFSGQEYCHNFISIDGMAIGPGYVLELPSLSEKYKKTTQGGFLRIEKGFTFSEYNPKSAFCALEAQDFTPALNGIFSWTLRNTDAKAQVTGEDKIDLSHVTLWAADHMVSAETFHAFSIKPGEHSEWTRTLCFSEL